MAFYGLPVGKRGRDLDAASPVDAETVGKGAGERHGRGPGVKEKKNLCLSINTDRNYYLIVLNKGGVGDRCPEFRFVSAKVIFYAAEDFPVVAEDFFCAGLFKNPERLLGLPVDWDVESLRCFSGKYSLENPCKMELV